MELRRLRALAALLATAIVLGLGTAGPALAARDPLLGQQWALGAADPIGAREAWARSAGAGVVVAVIDSGVQLDHPDLAGSVWTNPGEVANGVDDDGNGIVDDVHGANMLDNSANVADDVGHGTAVAGIVAARAGNGVGGSGIAPRARIMPVKVHDASGGSVSALARAIRYAVGEGARILNVSINAEGGASELSDAVRFAGQHGATVVASAGNDGHDIDARPSYPAALPDPALLSVTASTQGGGLMDAANRGRRSVDLAAPGDMILSTARGSSHALRAGTSMATPFVAGALALLSSARRDLSQARLRGALLAGSTRSRRLAGKIGAGDLDVGSAMHRIVPGRWGRLARSRLRLRAAGGARAGRRATVRWRATKASSVRRWSVALDGRRVRTLTNRRARRAHARITRAGRHRWAVTGYDVRGRKVLSAARSFRARAGSTTR